MDDKNPVREKHIRDCISFAEAQEADVEIFKGPESICVNLYCNDLVDITGLRDVIATADRVLQVPKTFGKATALSLTYHTHRIVFF